MGYARNCPRCQHCLARRVIACYSSSRYRYVHHQAMASTFFLFYTVFRKVCWEVHVMLGVVRQAAAQRHTLHCIPGHVTRERSAPREVGNKSYPERCQFPYAARQRGVDSIETNPAPTTVIHFVDTRALRLAMISVLQHLQAPHTEEHRNRVTVWTTASIPSI